MDSVEMVEDGPAKKRRLLIGIGSQEEEENGFKTREINLRNVRVI